MALDFDETRTDCSPGGQAEILIPVLIVLGDARHLGATRKVLRIAGSLEMGRRPDATGAQAFAMDDDRVSRRHAIITYDPRKGIAEIADLGSRNGTLVDGQPRGKEPTPLRPGALIFIGAYAAILRYVTAPDLEAIDKELADPFTPVASTSPALARKSRTLVHLARGSEDMLILGETGVGKEAFARAIHDKSGRPGKFVAINCPALPATLIESELFGYVKGAHSQAARDKQGLVDEAEHGTLFLDEFAEIPQEVQAKLLRFLEDKDLQPLGSTKKRHVDVRVLAATNRPLSALRQDITARLGPEPLRLPPLREHREDLAALASYFLRERPGIDFEVAAFQRLCLDEWPDNVRGLRKVIARAADLATAEGAHKIDVRHLPEGLGQRLFATPSDPAAPPISAPATATAPPPPGEPPGRAPAGRRSPRAPLDKPQLEALLARHGGVVSQAAREIDRDPAVLWRWIKRHGIEVDPGR